MQEQLSAGETHRAPTSSEGGLRAQLVQNVVLRHLEAGEQDELMANVAVVQCAKGEILLSQGDTEMSQYFVLEGILKRVVASATGREMILRFAAAGDIETSYAAWRLKTRAPYSIVTVKKARV